MRRLINSLRYSPAAIDLLGWVLVALLAGMAGAAYRIAPAPVHAQSSYACDQTISIVAASGTSATVFSATPGMTPYVCAYDISGDTAVTGLQWKSGTTNLSGAEVTVVDGHFTNGNGIGILIQGVTGQALTIAATTGSLAGWVRAGLQ